MKRDLIPRARRSVPRSVFGHERTTSVTVRKLLPRLKRELQRRHMRIQQHIRNDCGRDKVWLLRLDARIDIVPNVAVRPAVKSATFQRGKVIRWKIVSEAVTFIHPRPGLSPHPPQRQPSWIPGPGFLSPRVFTVPIPD